MQNDPYISIDLDEDGEIVAVTGQAVKKANLPDDAEEGATLLNEYREYRTLTGVIMICRVDPVTGRCR